MGSIDAAQVRADFDAYTGADGLLLLGGKRPSQNGLLYTSEKILIYRLLGIYSDTDFAEYQQAISPCRLEPGLFRRSTICKDQEAWDDLYGVSVASVGDARGMLEYAENHLWCFNNVNPGKFAWNAWMGKNLHFVGHLYLAAGETPPPLAAMGWKLWMRYHNLINSKIHDIWISNWISAQVALERGGEWADSARSFLGRLQWCFPGGILGLFKEYFVLENGQTDFNHPLVKWTPPT